ncbi:MAG: hypothetical protein JNK56_13070, partial [Myxococcales bacterium]|nr:hypothetical protein [Myxococcales bacterium]
MRPIYPHFLLSLALLACNTGGDTSETGGPAPTSGTTGTTGPEPTTAASTEANPGESGTGEPLTCAPQALVAP